MAGAKRRSASGGPTWVAGVDGAPAGWIAVIGSCEAPADAWAVAAPRLDDLFNRHRRVAHWAIDMPLGLKTDRRRECDQLARERLGRVKASSVFFAPPRALAEAWPVAYPDACRLAEAAIGKKVSKQTWHLLPKIAEVRTTLEALGSRRGRVFETHPELAFARLNDDEPLVSKKKDAEGRAEREALLGATFGAATVSRLVTQAEQTRGVGVDDLLDAMACWTAARREAHGDAICLPAEPAVDNAGLPIAIRF